MSLATCICRIAMEYFTVTTNALSILEKLKQGRVDVFPLIMMAIVMA